MADTLEPEFHEMPPAKRKRGGLVKLKPFDLGKAHGAQMRALNRYTSQEIERVCEREGKRADAYTQGLIAGLRGE
jgi:hypothetical protein